MSKIFIFYITIFATLFYGCSTTNSIEKKPIDVKSSSQIQNINIYTTKLKNSDITPKTIESAFNSVGLELLLNNDMNKPFAKRFHKTYYKIYNLALFKNNLLSYKLIQKYPKFGLLTPLTMSIWSDDANIYIATLTHYSMARISNIPLDDPDLLTYSYKIQTALKKALPKGHYKKLNTTPLSIQKALRYDYKLTAQEDTLSTAEYIEEFEAQFEGEIEPLGFLIPNFIDINEEILKEQGGNTFEFYHTYSLCKFDVIYPLSNLYPESGAWAPCSFYIYKKKDEPYVHLGFLSVENWIQTLNINDKNALKALYNTQKNMRDVMKTLTD